MEWLIGALALIIALFAWLLHGATNNRMKDRESELDEFTGVIDVRRNAENAKHDDPAAIKRVRDKYNS